MTRDPLLEIVIHTLYIIFPFRGGFSRRIAVHFRFYHPTSMMLSGNIKWSTKPDFILKNVIDEFQFSFINFPRVFIRHYVISLDYFLGRFSFLQRRLNYRNNLPNSKTCIFTWIPSPTLLTFFRTYRKGELNMSIFPDLCCFSTVSIQAFRFILLKVSTTEYNGNVRYAETNSQTWYTCQITKITIYPKTCILYSITESYLLLGLGPGTVRFTHYIYRLNQTV